MMANPFVDAERPLEQSGGLRDPIIAREFRVVDSFASRVVTLEGDCYGVVIGPRSTPDAYFIEAGPRYERAQPLIVTNENSFRGFLRGPVRVAPTKLPDNSAVEAQIDLFFYRDPYAVPAKITRAPLRANGELNNGAPLGPITYGGFGMAGRKRATLYVNNRTGANRTITVRKFYANQLLINVDQQQSLAGAAPFIDFTFIALNNTPIVLNYDDMGIDGASEVVVFADAGGVESSFQAWDS